MSDNPIHIVSDYESDVSSSARIWVCPNSHSLLLVHDYMAHKVMPLTVDSNSKRVPEKSLDERDSLLDSLEVLLSDDGSEEDHTEVHMPPSVLSDVE